MGDWVKLPGGGWVNLDLATDVYQKEQEDGTPYLAIYLPFLDEEEHNRQGVTYLIDAEDIAAVSAALDRRAGQVERAEAAVAEFEADLKRQAERPLAGVRVAAEPAQDVSEPYPPDDDPARLVRVTDEEGV